ncbi:Uncharacterised protein [Mycobacterium tuberculosis]|uniref:Uncharacterized protein n=1 Tax=Mycobacterium tuberculosis TaxID=1773 RepID=A0A655EG87_MYCTX|nr:Uncharacterised protein [Mycobacterium tuberculosis]
MPEIGARAGGDDAQLVGGVTAELDRLGPARQFDGPLRPAQTAFAIRDQRKQGGLAPHSSGCPQFGQRLRPIAAAVGGDSDSFAHSGDPAGPNPRRPRVAQSGFWVVVDQLAGSY